jgi:hypothetical protein
MIANQLLICVEVNNPMCKFSGGNHLSQVQRRVAKVNGE